MKTAALLVIGDEILSGKVKDENTFVFAKTMFERGVTLDRVEVLPDRIEVIGERVAELSKHYDYVCTSGGVGPTHDDITFDGVAYGFNLPLVVNAEALEFFRQAQSRSGRGDVVSDAQVKMLTFPTPCQVYFHEPLWLPLVQVKNVYVFPGVPYLFNKLLSAMSHLFTGEQFFLERIFTDQSETHIAAILKDAASHHPSIAIGSYPSMPGASFLVMATVQGRDEALVKKLAHDLQGKIAGRSYE